MKKISNKFLSKIISKDRSWRLIQMFLFKTIKNTEVKLIWILHTNVHVEIIQRVFARVIQQFDCFILTFAQVKKQFSFIKYSTRFLKRYSARWKNQKNSLTIHFYKKSQRISSTRTEHPAVTLYEKIIQRATKKRINTKH